MPIATQIRKRRLILGLTMQDIVDRLSETGVTLSKAALSKYENAKSVPKATVLRALAQVLECSTEYMFSDPIRKIEWLRFRRKTSMSRKLELEVKEAAREWLQARLLVDEALDTPAAEFELPVLEVQTIEEAEKASFSVRELWAAGDWPLESLSLAMEKSGVIVVEVDADKDLDGLSGVADGGIRFVAITSGVPVDRMRMNLAHELGHIVIKRTDDERFDEKAAFRFAASLLVPRSVVLERIGHSRTTVDLRELLLLKQEFGISIQALIRRCFDLGVIAEWTYRQLNTQMRAAGWHRNEPGDCSHLERPSQFRSHLLRCVTEGLVSEKELRSMFPEVARKMDELDSDSTWRWANVRDLPRHEREQILRKASRLSAEDYADDGSLAGLELVDDTD